MDRVFPESLNRHEVFRTVSHVFLQRHDLDALAAPQGDGPPQKLVVSNMHVVSGQRDHKIPGQTEDNRTAWKRRVVTKGIEKAVQFFERQDHALAAAQGERIDFVAAGVVADYNLHKKDVQQALENVKCEGSVVESLCIVNDEELLPRQAGKHRYFIVSSRMCEVDHRSGLPIAHDKEHRAVGIHMLAPIKPFKEEREADANLAKERARMQEERGRLATLAAAQGEEPQGEEPSVAAASGSASASAPEVPKKAPPPLPPGVRYENGESPHLFPYVTRMARRTVAAGRGKAPPPPVRYENGETGWPPRDRDLSRPDMVPARASAAPAAQAQSRLDPIAPATPNAAPAALAQNAALVAISTAPMATTPVVAAPLAVTSALDTSSVAAAPSVTDAASPSNNVMEAALPASTHRAPDTGEEDDMNSLVDFGPEAVNKYQQLFEKSSAGSMS